MALSLDDCYRIANCAGIGATGANSLKEAVDVTQGASLTHPYVDLRAAPYNVVAGDSTAAVAEANTAAINSAISTYSGTSAALVLPAGSIYVGQASGGANWSIKFNQTTDVMLVGQGMYATTLIQHGAGDGGDWHCVVMERTTRCGLANLGLMQGTITNPEAGQHQHLWTIQTIEGSGDNTDTVGLNLYFGKCLGDGIAFVTTGGSGDVKGARLNNIVMRLNGEVHPSRVGARTGISFQRGYKDISISNIDLYGAQNSLIDMESTGAADYNMDYVNFTNGYLDNSIGNTAIAMTFSGIGSGDKTQHARLSNFTIREGGLFIVSTSDAVVDNVTVIMENLRPADPSTPLLQVKQANDDILLRNLTLIRTGNAAAGLCLDIDNTGSRTTIEGGRIIQGTSSDPIFIERTTNLRINGLQLQYNGASPASRNAIKIQAVNGNCDGLQIGDMYVLSSGGKLATAVRLLSRTGRTMNNISVRGLHCAGQATTAVYLSKGTGSTMDTHPVIQGINAGADTVWKQVDENDSAITTIFPVVSGNKGGIATYVGQATPENNVTAIQGCKYVHMNGDSTTTWSKATGTAATGWVQVTIP